MEKGAMSGSLQKKPLVIALVIVVVGGGVLFSQTQRSAEKESQTKGGDTSASVPVDLEGASSIPQFWRDMDQSGSVKLYGRISGLSARYTTAFQLGRGDTTSMIWFDGMVKDDGTSLPAVSIDGLNDGMYAVVTGVRSPDGYSVWAESISPVSEEAVAAYEASQKPKLEMEITEYPATVAHVCDEMNFQVRVKNIGQVPVEHARIYDYESLYNIFMVINGEATNSYSFEDDGTIAEVGVQDFGTLAPGEEKVVTIGGGGRVTQSIDTTRPEDSQLVGIAGERNILGGWTSLPVKTGANTVQFKLGLIQDDFGPATSSDPLFTSESNIVTIDLTSDQCDMDDINDTYYVKYD